MAWPKLGSREVPWTPTLPPDLVPRSIRELHQGPYAAAVVPFIAEATPAVSSGAAALAEEAAAEVARFDAEQAVGAAGPDDDDGSGPLPFLLLRSESASSSQIEGLTSGARAIAVAELGGGATRNAELVLGNVRSMQAALALADDLTADALLAMQRALLEASAPSIAGRWRSEQVWIGGDTYGPHGAEFVPPHHEDVPALIDDLVAFSARGDVQVLVHTALAHAQFETVHPFADGNGRTGRALVHALLRRRGLARRVTVPVSAGLLTDVGGYFDALTAYRGGEVDPIVEVMSRSALAAVVNGRQLAAELRSVRARWDDVVVARRDSAAWRLADLLLRQPVVDSATIARELGLSPANAARPLAPLVEAGVVRETTGRDRGRLWQADEVLAALDAFAARAGRRSAS
ncbi:Fic family protein [Quadrisphaera granulorum]|uniref:Fic family protein n=1 Tax=Quadrisphaera granulorum TaxID=317664 RepID=A0A316A2J6_9ACTN|nr:Fic family protein [Quadrisphaera granulorum]SZE97840.1 Fic family protein [Quadrisphaera granulorum]